MSDVFKVRVITSGKFDGDFVPLIHLVSCKPVITFDGFERDNSC